MKKNLVFTLLLVTFYGKAQNIFDYEKEVPNKDLYSYEDIGFRNTEENLSLSGTLIKPKEDFKSIVIIVPGSGMDTRNSHYLLTEALLKSGIAVYRYDERGTGKSGGKYNRANYTITMMANDLYYAFTTLKNNTSLSHKQIGLLGHSQGGMVTMNAYGKGANADFLIQWSTPVQKHGEFLKYQIKTGQNTFDDVLKYGDKNKKLEVMTVLHKVVEDNKNDNDMTLAGKLSKISRQIGYDKKYYDRFPYLTLSSEKDLVRKNFEPAYKNISVPLLYIIGSADTFVDPVAEPELLKSFKNSNITIKIMEKQNHYLAPDPLSLNTIYEIDHKALDEIIGWIKTNGY